MSRRSIRHEHEIVIHTDANQAWRLSQNIARYPEWVGVTLAALDGPSVAEVGAVYRERIKVVGPLTTVGTWAVAVCDDETLFQRHECADEPGPVKSMWIEMRVVTHGSAARFVLAIGCDITAGPLTRLLAAVLSRKLERGNAENIRQFAALLEQPATPDNVSSGPGSQPYQGPPRPA